MRKLGRTNVQVGAAPGTLVADPNALKPVLRVIAYGPDGVLDEPLLDLARLHERCGKRPVTWINVDGLGDVKLLEQLGGLFGVHRLVLEDVVNQHQRAKFEDYERHAFLVVRTLNPAGRLDTEQLSILLGKDWLLTFQEKPGDAFDPVRKRIHDGKGRMRHSGPDYLAYALIDAQIDAFFPAVERYGERLDALEDVILDTADHKLVVREIHSIKRDLLTLRRCVWPQREAIATMMRDEGTHFTRETKVYLRDCYDHVVQLLDLLENYREICASLMEAYLSSVSNRMNEIMKVLTVIATIFIPLTFVVGVYGMNFDYAGGEKPLNMPELHWKYGYVACWAIMLAAAIGMLVYFRRRRWI